MSVLLGRKGVCEEVVQKHKYMIREKNWQLAKTE